MPKSPEKIRQQMADLEQELEQAEKERRDKNRHKIRRAAERSGLDKLTLSTRELESHFKQIAKQKRKEKPEQDKSASHQTGTESGASSNANTAQSNGNTGDPSTLKRPADNQHKSEQKTDDR